MRLRMTVQRLLVYATFITVSVALHMVVILGTPEFGTSTESGDSTAAISSGEATQ